MRETGVAVLRWQGLGRGFASRPEGIQPRAATHRPLAVSARARRYGLKQTTNTVFARITEVERVMDVESLSRETSHRALAMNDIGTVSLTLQKPIVADAYAE